MHYLDPDRGSGTEEVLVPNSAGRSFGVYNQSWVITGIRIVSYETIMKDGRIDHTALDHRVCGVVGVMRRREFLVSELVAHRSAERDGFMPMYLLIPPRQNFDWEADSRSMPAARIQFSWRLASSEEEKTWCFRHGESDPFERIVEASS